MKILFLTYHGFDPGSGITKKMLAQVKSLRQNGHEVHVCYYDYAPDGHLCRFVDQSMSVGIPADQQSRKDGIPADQQCTVVLKDYGRGARAAIWQRMSYGCIADYCISEGIEMVYSRNYQNASPWVVALFRRLRRHGVHSVQEIPTYPYDGEFKGFPWDKQLELLIDKMFRRQLARQMDAVVTFTDAQQIFGQRTINISNGVDFDIIPLHNFHGTTDRELHIIAVAEVHTWHGFDRFIHGLGEYYTSHLSPPTSHLSPPKVFFHIVGDVWPNEMNGVGSVPGFATYIRRYGIEDYVVFHGKLFGKELDEVFDKCCFAVGSLARHRSGITHIKTLKNREYACRGIPFVYSECDSDFDDKPYVMKVPADESPIDIRSVIDFIHSSHFRPEDIRSTVAHLSWKIQMQKVVDSLPLTPPNSR